MPDILIGSLVAAEANTGTEQALSSPHVTGNHLQLTNSGGFRAVHLHPHRPLHVGFQKLLEQLILLILVNINERSQNCGYLYSLTLLIIANH